MFVVFSKYCSLNISSPNILLYLNIFDFISVGVMEVDTLTAALLVSADITFVKYTANISDCC